MAFWLCSDLDCFSFDLDFDRFCFLLDVLLLRMSSLPAATTDLVFRFGMLLERFVAFGAAAARRANGGLCCCLSRRRQDAYVYGFCVDVDRASHTLQQSTKIHSQAVFSLHELSQPREKDPQPDPIGIQSNLLELTNPNKSPKQKLPNTTKINRLFVSNLPATTKSIKIYFQSTLNLPSSIKNDQRH